MGRKGTGNKSKSKPSKPGTRGGARAPSALARNQPHFDTMTEMAQWFFSCVLMHWVDEHDTVARDLLLNNLPGRPLAPEDYGCTLDVGYGAQLLYSNVLAVRTPKGVKYRFGEAYAEWAEAGDWPCIHPPWEMWPPEEDLDEEETTESKPWPLPPLSMPPAEVPLSTLNPLGVYVKIQVGTDAQGKLSSTVTVSDPYYPVHLGKAFAPMPKFYDRVAPGAEMWPLDPRRSYIAPRVQLKFFHASQLTDAFLAGHTPAAAKVAGGQWLGCVRALWDKAQVKDFEDSNSHAEAYDSDYIEEMLQDVDFYMD